MLLLLGGLSRRAEAENSRYLASRAPYEGGDYPTNIPPFSSTLLPKRWILLRPLDCHSRRLVQILLLAQPQNVIVQPTARLEIAVAIRVQDPRVQHAGKAEPVSLLHLRHAGVVAFLVVLVGDFPVVGFGVGDAHDGLEHVFLADEERRDAHEFFAELAQARALVVFVVREDLQGEQAGDAAAALRPGAGIDAGGAVVDEGDGAVFEVEAEGFDAVG